MVDLVKASLPYMYTWQSTVHTYIHIHIQNVIDTESYWLIQSD